MAKGITVPVVQSGLEASIEAAAKKAGPLSLSASVDPSSFKRLAQPLGRVSGLATEFEKSIAASNARVIAFGASVGIINGVQNAFTALVKTTIEVEKSLANIAVISGKTTQELEPFSRALFEIAKTTSQSFQTASEAALEFSRQGLGLEETLKRTQDALTLTRFTTLSAAEAVDVLTAAANSFGATGITTSEILNKLVAVDTKFAVSAEDLAKGLSRAGSIAQEVGVTFDELNAIVTIAQERTARGGAVIGNAFKTIFTRIRSDETIKALQSIGIYSFDAEGRLRPVVSLLEELAGKINTLSETKRIEVLEAIASKYNINVLTALVDDLGSTASKFREARDVSAGAQSEAYQRQIELNQTLDAVITRVTNSAAQLADTLGRIGVTDSLKSLLNFFDNILTGINDVIDSEGIGGTIAKGLISGLSGVFFKIGIPLLLAIFVKLTKDIAQFGAESLKTILGINKEVRERQALEQAVVNTLIKDQQVMATILSLSGDRRKQEEYLLSVYNRQLAALQQVQTIAAGVAPALQAAGLSATSGTVKRRAAEGYLPAAEAKDVRRGVGGASPSSKVVEIPNFSFGGGKRGTMVANTSEYIVPNYGGGSGTAIFNQDMAKEYGLPPGAKKITAAGGFVPANGFVPNFAAKKFNVFDQARAKVKKDQEPIDYVDLDGMRRSAYLTLDASIDPVGRFSKLQSSAQQKLTEKLGPIAENAKIVPDQGSIEFVQINKSLQRDDLVQKIRETKNKIQANPKAKIDKDIEDIIQSILPETKGSVDNNLKAAVKTELQVQGPAAFRSGNVLEDILFKKITGTIEGRNSKTWDLPAEQSGAFKSRFGFKSKFGDIKLGSSTSSISSFIGKHIISPTGQNASEGYIPNFARYVYDADRVDADKNNLLKAILASRVKKNLIVGPAGSGKSTYGESLGSFITNIAQLTDASEIDILSGAARTKDGGVSKNFQQISDAVNASGGKISYLYTGNMDILSRRTGRIAEGPKQGDLRSKKQIAGSMFAPLNQFDFISKVKGSAKNFEMIRGAKGYVPNFADKKPATIKGGKVDRKTYTGPRALVSAQGIAGMIVPDQANQETMTNYLKENPWGFQTKEDVYLPPENSLITNVKYNTYGLNEKAFEGQALKKSGTQTLIEADVEKAGIEIAKKWATKYSDEYAKKMPGRSVKTNYDENFIRTSFTSSEGAVSAISTLGGGIFESSIRAALDTQVGQRIEKAQKEDSNNRLDFPVNPFLKELFGIEGGEQFVDAKISGSPGSTGRKLADQIVAAGLYKTERVINTKTAAQGYVPNFAEIKKQQELLAPSGQFYDLDTADKFLAASNVSVENQPSAPKGLGDELKRRILEAAQKVYGPNAKIGVSRLPGKREAFTSAVLKNPALADDFIALQRATTGGVGPIANTPEALAKFNNPTPFDPGPPPAVRAVGGKGRAVKKVGPMSLNAIEGYIPNFASQNALDAMRRIIADPAAPQGEKDAAASKLAQLSKVTSSGNPRTTAQKTVKAKLPITEEDKAYLNQNKEKITAGMGRSFGMLFNLDALEVGDLNYVRRLDPVIAKKLSEIIQKQGGRDSIRSLIDFGSAARGYIPNFADNEPLKEALNREVAAGVPPARVRVTQDQRLKNSKNPNGLAVINTRDEPNGKIPSDFRERGMRAAMASRGFVPNFAEGVSLKGGTKFTTETQDIMGGAPISAPFPKEELAKLRKVLNEAVAAYEAEIKAGKDLEEAKKKLNEATNKATREANLSKESASKVQSAVAKTAGTITPENKNDSKNIDIGKFLVLQTAIVGATSALQAFTEENSNAANAIEGVNAGLSGFATFASLATSVNLPLRILLGSLTALASAAPLISRIFESQKTPADRASEALTKLAKEAERTGQKLTPESILAKLAESRTEGIQKQESVKVSDIVSKALATQGVDVPSDIIKKISLVLSSTGNVIRDKEGKITDVNSEALSKLLQGAISSPTNATPGVPYNRAENIDFGGNPIIAPEIGIGGLQIDQNKIQENLLAELSNQVENEKQRLSIRQQGQVLDKVQQGLLTRDNELLLSRQKALESIFQTQLKINEKYNEESLRIEGLSAALEREKQFRTESYAISQKAALDKEKAEAEYNKTVAQIALDLRKNLGAGAKESVLGGTQQVQDFLGNLDTGKLQGLIDGYANALKTNEQALKDGTVKIDDVFGSVWSKFTEGLVGVPPELNNLILGSKEQFLALVRSAYETKANADQTRILTNTQIDFAATNSEANTELRKLQSAYKQNRSRLAYLNSRNDGSETQDITSDEAAAVEEQLNIQREKLITSIQDLEIANAEEIALLPEKKKADLQRVLITNGHAKSIRELTGIDQAAAIAASNLSEETDKRVFQLKTDAKNAELKLNTDINLLNAETDLIDAYNQAYKGSIQTETVAAKLRSAQSKLTKSESDKDDELQVQIALIQQNWKAESRDIQRKTELLREQNKKISVTQQAIRLEEQLNLEAEQLIEARRKASAALSEINLTKAIENQITSAGTANIQEITKTIVQGRALTKAGVQSSFEQQARASVFERRMAGRTEVDLRESTNILNGRDNSIQQNLQIQRGVLLDQAETFQQIIGNQTPKLFADGMAEAMQAALNQADDLGGALRNVALNFLKSLQSAFLQSASRQIVASILPTGAAKGGYVKGYATGGLVTGGSGYKDDVPAMLSEGEYVIRKSSVKKYGASNLQKLNSGEAPKFAAGGIFLPGIRGQTEISGYKDLTAFAKQTTTSGATDVLAGGATTAFANLEDQSSRLSAYALMREDDTINQEIRSAQEQAMNIMAEREAYRTAERKAFQKQLVGTVASAALSYGINAGVGKLGSLFSGAAAAGKGSATGLGLMDQISGKTQFLTNAKPFSFQSPPAFNYSFGPTKAYGGMIKRYNAGGPTDDIPALLMGGEYVMNRQATKKYGKQFFDSINQGRAPRFADGGQVSTAEPSFAEKAATSSDSKAAGATNVSININVTGGTSDTQTQGDTKQGGIDYKKMSEQIKQVVIQTINEEKRLGGSLRSR